MELCFLRDLSKRSYIALIKEQRRINERYDKPENRIKYSYSWSFNSSINKKQKELKEKNSLEEKSNEDLNEKSSSFYCSVLSFVKRFTSFIPFFKNNISYISSLFYSSGFYIINYLFLSNYQNPSYSFFPLNKSFNYQTKRQFCQYNKNSKYSTFPLSSSLKAFSSKSNQLKDENSPPLSSFEDNVINYLHDQSIEWESNKSSHKFSSLDKIGNFQGFDFSEESLAGIEEFNENVVRLQKIFNNFKEINSYAIAFLVWSEIDNCVLSLDKHILVNKDSKALDIMKHIYYRISVLSNLYNFTEITIITVRIRPLNFKVKNPTFNTENINVKNEVRFESNSFKKSNLKLFNYKYLPNSMDFKFYGQVILAENNNYLFKYNNVYIKVSVDYKDKITHDIEVFSFNTSNYHVIGKAKDIQTFDDSTFKRELNIGNQLFNLDFKDQNLVNIEYKPKVKFISPVNKNYIKKTNFLTFDIETYIDNNEFIPYSCGFYDGKDKFTYYLTDFKNSEDMLVKCLSDILIPKYHNYIIYCHNFAKFDYLFLRKILLNKFNGSKIISKELDILSISMDNNLKGKNKVKLTFRDSLSLLPISLDKLSKSFNVEIKKDFFPYSFVNKNNLNYIGNKPELKYYKNIPIEIYLSIKNDEWSMRSETEKYLAKDLISLYQILYNFNDIIFGQYRSNITEYVTISSLAMGIFRSSFLKNINNKGYKLTQTSGGIENAIRASYFGGRVEVFKPCGESLNYYDFNSLYPTAMLKPMPVGEPKYSKIKDLNEIFGFVHVKVISSNNDKPVLPVRILQNGEEKLIFPNGEWSGWYFSEELKLAKEYGYQIEVIESYIFDKGFNVFDDYVNKMAFVKNNSEGAMRETHKLLLNTLYGRMGMKNYNEKVEIVSTQKALQLFSSNNIIDNFKLECNKEYIRYNTIPDSLLCEQTGCDFNKLIVERSEKNIDSISSTAIASATASWARVLMYPFIKNSFYSDTDSILIDSKLNNSLVGKDLGLFKMEYENINEAFFPAPKLYYLQLQNGVIISKRKGFTAPLTKTDYKNLLIDGSSIQIEDHRWKKNFNNSTLNVSNHGMNILSGYDKRTKLYSKGKWVSAISLYKGCADSSYNEMEGLLPI